MNPLGSSLDTPNHPATILRYTSTDGQYGVYRRATAPLKRRSCTTSYSLISNVQHSVILRTIPPSPIGLEFKANERVLREVTASRFYHLLGHTFYRRFGWKCNSPRAPDPHRPRKTTVWTCDGDEDLTGDLEVDLGDIDDDAAR
ncbi:hypothetical protein EAF04_006432 [Stromatinia cepivora]|nr:hypothetical protein EAF04_006432 [Stromatinia cepivora]